MNPLFKHPVRIVEGISEYLLPNGLKVLLFPDDSQQKVTVNITYLVGSRHEGRGEAGMAHLLEHMLFKGTPAHPNVKGALQDRGALFNATTWFDRTNYYETLSASDDNLEFALRLEADRMINSWIRQEDLDAEMTVVRNEFEMGENNPVHVLHDQMMAAAYQWHNYGKTTIGNRSDIERVPVKNLKQFYEHYYQPDNAVLIVAGHFDLHKTHHWIGQYFASIPAPHRKLDQTYTEEPTQDGVRNVRLYRVGDTAQSAAAYHVPSASHADYVAIRLLVDMLTDEPSGLLYENLVKTGAASELFGMAYALKEPGLVMFFARPDEIRNADSLLEKLVHQLEHLDETSLTTEKVERAKTRFLKHVKLAIANSKDLALKLSESIAQGDYRLFFYNRDRIKNATIDDVLRVAKDYFLESNRTTGIFIPTPQPVRADIPPSPSIEALLENYTGSEQVTVGENFIATPENIEARTQRKLAAHKIKTAILNKATRGEVNHARLVFRFGDEKSLVRYRHSLSLLPSLIRRGSAQNDFVAIQDRLDQIQSTLSIYAAQPGACIVDITSDKKNLSSAISLASELMQTPRLAQDEFEVLKKRELADLEEIKTDPMKIGMNELERMKNPFPHDSLHYVPTFTERISELEKVQLSDLQNLYHHLYGSNHLELAVVGDCNENISEVFAKHFGNWNTASSYERVHDTHVEAIPETRLLHTPDKQMAVVAMGANFPLRDDDLSYPAIRLGNYIFGESMKSRLMQRLREKEGFSYGAGSYLDISRHDSAGSITLYAMCATHQVKPAMKAMEEEYDRFINQGVADEELKEAKQGYELFFHNLLANDLFVVNSLASMLDIDRTFGYYKSLISGIHALSPQDIQKAWNRFLASAQVAKIKCGSIGPSH